MIPITKLMFGQEEEELLLSSLRNGIIAQGPLVEEFEKTFAQRTGVNYAIAVNNGTTSLVATLQALMLEPGDEVITSPFTFIATLNAILEAGATAVFADISDKDFNLDPNSIEEKITPRTRAIMPVHLYGQMADMEAISQIAQKHSLRIVEDSAQSHFATQNGKCAGSYDLGSFSFYATKNLTTGEGGLITTNDPEIASKLRIMRNQGMKERYQYEMAGHNYRMTDIQAALVIPQLRRYDDLVKLRNDNAQYYADALNKIEGIVLPKVLDGRTHVWHQYTLRITEESGTDRDQLSNFLSQNKIGSGIYYPRLVTEYEAYKGRPDVVLSNCPVASRVSKEVISIPVHPYLNVSERAAVATAVRDGILKGRK